MKALNKIVGFLNNKYVVAITVLIFWIGVLFVGNDINVEVIQDAFITSIDSTETTVTQDTLK